MADANEYSCIRDSTIQNHTQKITELETRATYKEKRIDELYQKIDTMEKKIDLINDNVNKIMMKSVQGDSEIDKRVTSLETTVKVLRWETTLLFGSGLVWVIYSFIH